MRWQSLVVPIGVVLTLVVAGCGGGSTPTSVSVSDLSKNGDFWNSLTPDLKQELAEFGKEKLGNERPEGTSEIRAVRNDELVAEMDTQFSNDLKQQESIYDIYVGSNDQIASENFDALVPGLEAGG